MVLIIVLPTILVAIAILLLIVKCCRLTDAVSSSSSSSSKVRQLPPMESGTSNASAVSCTGKIEPPLKTRDIYQCPGPWRRVVFNHTSHTLSGALISGNIFCSDLPFTTVPPNGAWEFAPKCSSAAVRIDEPQPGATIPLVCNPFPNQKNSTQEIHIYQDAVYGYFYRGPRPPR